MDADDAAAGPLAQLRVGTRLEAEGSEHGRRRAELRLDVEAADRRLHSRCADGDLRAEEDATPVTELERPVAAVDHDRLRHRLHADAGGGDPARSAVGTTGEANPVPRRLSVSITTDGDSEHDAWPEVV